jgi:peptidoglycan pentaglycine glycine transferase (the first glycine)
MSSYTFHELAADEPFDPNTLAPSVPFTQNALYGEWQRGMKRPVRRVTISRDEKVVLYAQLIAYPLLRGKTYLYAPYGPVLTDSTPELIAFLKKELTRIAKEEHAAFVRLDFTPTLESPPTLSPAPRHTYHSGYFQPRAEWYLPLSDSEEDLIAHMHEKNRYSVRQSLKRGVECEIVTENFTEYFDTFYSLMADTAARNGFSLHEREYYEHIFSTLTKDHGYLSVARYAGAILVVDLIVYSGGIANYVFSGSSNDHRTLLPSYAALWCAIAHAKSIGCTDFNFGGIDSPEHPHKSWVGLTKYKMRFGGHSVIHSNFHDVIVEPLWYHLYNLRKLLKSLRT